MEVVFFFFCCCRFSKVIPDSKVFCNNHFWLLHGYAQRARWALSSTTKAGFKIIAEPGRTNTPVHMPTHPADTSLSMPNLAERPEPLKSGFCRTCVQLIINKSTWGTWGGRNKHGWASGDLSVILSLCNSLGNASCRNSICSPRVHPLPFWFSNCRSPAWLHVLKWYDFF